MKLEFFELKGSSLFLILKNNGITFAQKSFPGQEKTELSGADMLGWEKKGYMIGDTTGKKLNVFLSKLEINEEEGEEGEEGEVAKEVPKEVDVSAETNDTKQKGKRATSPEKLKNKQRKIEEFELGERFFIYFF